jgi:hypothetical protein
MADVFVDGGFAARVDLYSPNEVVQATVFSTGGLPDGPHTLRIDVTGEKNPAATSAWVIVDAFDVALPAAAASVTRVQESDPSINYTGTADWPLAGFTPLWSGENARWSTVAGTRATFTFTGTSVRWIGERGFATGIARISLDGAFIAAVDTRTPFQEEYQATLFWRDRPDTGKSYADDRRDWPQQRTAGCDGGACGGGRVRRLLGSDWLYAGSEATEWKGPGNRAFCMYG